MHRLNFILLGLIAGICYIIVANDGLLTSGFQDVRLGSLTDIRGCLTIMVFAGLFVTAKFLVLGCLLYSVYHFHRKKTEYDVFSNRRWPVVLIGVGLTAGLCGMRVERLPDIFTLVLPCFACLLGVWIASNCLRGLRTTIRLVPKVGILALVVTGLGAITLYFTTSDEALAFEPAHVSADEKARLAKLIRKSENLDNGSLRLYLTETDVNLLMAVAFERLPIDGKANAQLRDGIVELDWSLGVPLGGPFGRYINSRGVYRLEIQDGMIEFRPIQLSVGKLQIPAFLLSSLGDFAGNMARADKNANAVISSIDRIRFTDQRMEAIGDSESLRQELKLAFHHHLGASNEVINAASSHARQLVDSAASLPGGDQQFSALLRSAFTFARKRSSDGRDPTVENRAAIMALAIVLGHYRVEAFVGDVTDDRVKAEAGRYRGKVTLRGRRDWTRHFFVSAGLALAFNSNVSDGAGLFKEEIDSAEGGSGFSFSDLLADRAGVRFAMAATRDRKSAERMQKLLTSQFSIDDVFPPAGDLPEGLRDAAFQQQFGGVNGIVYNLVLAEIERRLDTCRALRSTD